MPKYEKIDIALIAAALQSLNRKEVRLVETHKVATESNPWLEIGKWEICQG
ncbi:MAG: hypothetical protein N3A65_09465 [candidate division WOR-3 bacterium]|nr:hypothetical protein [candidate division WOR-3 bacterium]